MLHGKMMLVMDGVNTIYIGILAKHDKKSQVLRG
jgi:hypothetical protein